MPKVLIIENDVVLSHGLKDLLQLEWPGVQIDIIGHGEEGIRLAQRERPLLILIGGHAEDTKGHKTAHRLRGLPETSQSRLIGLALPTTPADFDHEALTNNLHHDYNTLLFKPFSPRALIEAVGRLSG